MTIRVSSKFKERILGTESFANIFNGGRILVYSGTQPASADDAVTGTLLAQVTEQGLAWAAGGSPGGLNFGQSGVWATGSSTQAWKLVASVAGTAGWFRLVGRLGDLGTLSYSSPRIDGSVGTGVFADMKLPTVALTAGYTVPVQQFLFSFPPIIGA